MPEVADRLPGNSNGFFSKNIPENEPAAKNQESAEQANKAQYTFKRIVRVRQPGHIQHKRKHGR
jgi:hypothetical protein